jgi:hypothetical protein
MTQTFTMRAARAAALPFLVAVNLALGLETVILHLILRDRYPTLNLVLVVLTVSSFIWVFRDVLSLGAGRLEWGADVVRGTIGRRLTFDVPNAAVLRIEPPGLMPASGHPKGYLNITKPAVPNVVIVFAAPVPMRVLGMRRDVTQLALRVDEPVRLLQTAARRGADARPSAGA